jgi:hypothetical protein
MRIDTIHRMPRESIDPKEALRFLTDKSSARLALMSVLAALFFVIVMSLVLEYFDSQ